MHDSLGDAFVVEVKDLLAKVKVFEQGWSARSDAKRVLVIRDGNTLLGGQDRHVLSGCLM
jgi:hypothetical protein